MLFYQFLNLITYFSDFFPSHLDFNESKKSQTRISIPNGNYYISDSTFLRVSTFIGHGGAIYMLNNDECYFLIENSYFYQCRTEVPKKWGGAIFININGSIVFNKICGNQCYTQHGDSGYNQFSYTHIRNIDKQHEIIYTSISECCFQSIGYRYCPLTLWNGIQKVLGLNSSKNSPSHICGISIKTPNNSLLLECTFSNNYARHSRCIELKYSNNLELNRINIINNDYLEKFGGLIDISLANVYLNECIFIGNVRNFHTTLFYTFQSNITLNECYFDIFKTTNSDIKFKLKKKSGTLINLKHFNTIFCQAIDPI